MIRLLTAALAALALGGCINPASTDCSRGAWLGGAAGTSRCASSSAYYRSDPRYTLGIPFETIEPGTGATVIVPGSEYRARQALRPLRRAFRESR